MFITGIIGKNCCITVFLCLPDSYQRFITVRSRYIFVPHQHQITIFLTCITHNQRCSAFKHCNFLIFFCYCNKSFSNGKTGDIFVLYICKFCLFSRSVQFYQQIFICQKNSSAVSLYNVRHIGLCFHHIFILFYIRHSKNGLLIIFCCICKSSSTKTAFELYVV